MTERGGRSGSNLWDKKQDRARSFVRINPNRNIRGLDMAAREFFRASLAVSGFDSRRAR